MNKVAIVYWSGTGNTEAMAHLVEEGAQNAGASVTLFLACEFSQERLDEYDAVGFGCPSMGAEQLEESEFEPMFSALSIDGKKIALFGSYGWGDGKWMRTWEASCKDSGAVLVCDYVIANEAPDEEAAQACKNLGAALAKA